MNKQIKIYVTEHIKNSTDITYFQNNKKIVNLINVNDTNWENENIFHLNCFLCEFTTLYYVWKNQIKSDYVGFCHYRRKLPIKYIKDNISTLNNDYMIFDRTSWYKGVFFPILEHLSIFEDFEKYLKDYDQQMFDIYKEKYDKVPGRCMFLTTYDNFDKLCRFMFTFLNNIIPSYNVIDYIMFINQQINKNYNIYIGQNLDKTWYTKFKYDDVNIYRMLSFILEYMCGLYIEYDSKVNNKKIYFKQFSW